MLNSSCKDSWLPIPGIHFYECNRNGLVRSTIPGRKVKVLKPVMGGLYPQVNLNKKTYRIHRLVAMTWIENPDSLPFVNHIDGNKENPAVENLEWCTPRENCLHAVRTGIHRSGRNFGTSHGKSRGVCQYSLQGELLREWPYLRDAAHTIGISENQICRTCSNGRGSAGGFQWRYASLGIDKISPGGQKRRRNNMATPCK